VREQNRVSATFELPARRARGRAILTVRNFPLRPNSANGLFVRMRIENAQCADDFQAYDEVPFTRSNT
jgi:hypothetical protein